MRNNELHIYYISILHRQYYNGSQRNRVDGYELDSFDLGRALVVSSCEHINYSLDKMLGISWQTEQLLAFQTPWS
jgi:hypothetical protein